ncbi:clpC, partial [Symbiodinium sp. CCMP2456]
ALLEFRRHLRELVEAGETYEAALLWGSVLEVNCARCLRGRGGFRFPFVGTYARRSIVVSADMPPAQAWESYHRSGEDRLNVADVFGLGSGLWPTDLLPDHANRLLRHVESQEHPRGATPSQLWKHCGEPGSVASYSGGSRPTFRFPLGRRVGVMSGRGPTERFGFCSGPWRRWRAAPVRWTRPQTSAETVVDRMAAQAVASFRERHGLLEDNDFAYAFSSWEEAAENAGHAVADAWSELSQDLEDDALMSLVDRAVAAGAAAPPATQPVVRLSKMMRKRPANARARAWVPSWRKAKRVLLMVASSAAATLLAAKTRRYSANSAATGPETSGLCRRWGAAVAEPGMIEELEHRVTRMYEQGDPRWSCLLADWLIMAGCGGFAWAEAWVEFYGSLPATARKHCGLCFDPAGRPWQLRQVTMLTQEVFSGMEPPVTTYSWRRVAPSVGTLLQLDELSMLALGDWQDKGRIRETGAAMPLRYSGTRYAASVRVKHLVLSATARCLFNAADPGLREEVGEKVRLDSTVIWRAPAGTPGPEAKLAFKETALRLRRQSRAVTAGETRRSPEEPVVMPAQVNGRVCSAFLRNGMRLCPAFQSQACRAANCALAHQCAAVLRSGRVCGGRHPARECHDRRLVKPGDVPPAITVAQEAAAGATRPPLPRVRPPALPVVSTEETDIVEVEVEVEEPAATRPKAKPKQKAMPKKRRALPKEEPAAGDAWRNMGNRPRRAEPASSSSEPAPHLVASWVDRPRSSGSREGAAAGADRGRGRKRPHEDAESRYDRLAREGHRVDRRALEFPTEIWRSLAGGKLYLGGLPTRANPANFPDIALQVTAMAKSPAITSGDRRDSDFQSLLPLVRATLHEGQNVLTHCMAGRHRGAAAGTVLRSILSGDSLDISESYIQERREIELSQIRRQNRDLSDWMLRTVRLTKLGAPPPLPVAYT